MHLLYIYVFKIWIVDLWIVELACLLIRTSEIDAIDLNLHFHFLILTQLNAALVQCNQWKNFEMKPDEL